MSDMDQNSQKKLERELIFVLKEEYSFYQSLYIIIDKQRDTIKFQNDEKLLDLFAEIERCHMRIRLSNDKIESIRRRDPELFVAATSAPDVKRIVNSIATMIKKNMNLVTDCEKFLKGKYERIKVELSELKGSHKILQYMNTGEETTHLVDGKK